MRFFYSTENRVFPKRGHLSSDPAPIETFVYTPEIPLSEVNTVLFALASSLSENPGRSFRSETAGAVGSHVINAPHDAGFCVLRREMVLGGRLMLR